MFKLFIIIFRETLEIALLLGIIAAATSGIKNRFVYINCGIVLGVIGALFATIFASEIFDSFGDYGQELFQSVILLVAAIMIIWTLCWMKQSPSVVPQYESSAVSLVLVTASSIFREAIEMSLFGYGAIASTHDSVFLLLIGASSGFVIAGLAGFLMYRGILNIPKKYLFKATSVILSLIAAGMVAEAANSFSASQIIDFQQEPLWNSSYLLSQNSFLGSALHFLVGYVENPTGLELASYILTLLFIVIIHRKRSITKSTV